MTDSTELAARSEPDREPSMGGAPLGVGTDVALLIDYENLQRSLKGSFGVDTPQMSAILDAARDYGRLVVARAYANWTRPDLVIDAENLYRQGIELVYVPGRKNSADIRLAVDAVDVSTRSARLRTFVIVTGDGDLIHPVNHLRLGGRDVVVIGVDASMSDALAAAADQVLLYERDLDPSVMTRSGSDLTIGTAVLPDLVPRTGALPPTAAFDLIVDVIERYGRAGRINFQDLGNRLLSEHGFRPMAWYGVRLSMLLEVAQRAGVVVLTTSGGSSYAGLPDAAGVTTPPEQDRDGERREQRAAESDPLLADVRLESLTEDERSRLLGVLDELARSPTLGYLSFNLMVARIVGRNALPRLNEQQVRRLVNHLADRPEPILIREPREGRNADGELYTYNAFRLTDDISQLSRTSAPAPRPACDVETILDHIGADPAETESAGPIEADHTDGDHPEHGGASDAIG